LITICMIGGDENKKRILVIGDDLTFFQSEKAIFKIPEGAVINLFLLLVTNKTGVPERYAWGLPSFVEL
jgi:hypothetical protein